MEKTEIFNFDGIKSFHFENIRNVSALQNEDFEVSDFVGFFLPLCH